MVKTEERICIQNLVILKIISYNDFMYVEETGLGVSIANVYHVLLATLRQKNDKSTDSNHSGTTHVIFVDVYLYLYFRVVLKL